MGANTSNVVPGPWQRSRPSGKIRRAFQAAKRDRLSADWLSSGEDINLELRHALQIIRSRARELEQNSNTARRFLSLCETHIVGPQGFLLQVKGKQRNGKLDDKRNRVINDAWWDWMRPGVGEITGRLSGPAWQRLAARTAARDGEVLIRMHDVQPTLENPYGFVVEMLDPARLDERYNDDLPDGRRVRLGVEMDRSGRPVAYHLKTGETTMYATSYTHERVPAEDLIHFFVADRPEQVRGVSWMASAMMNIHMMGAYQDAAVTAARWGAAKMGFFEAPEGGGPGDLATDKDGRDFITEAEPGEFEVVPEGYRFVSHDPKYPHENYDPFVRTTNRDLSMGLGVSYHSMTGDLSDVNYGSMRGGALEEREGWQVRQDAISDTILSRVYVRWLSAAAFNRALGLGTMGQDEIIGRFRHHLWQGRRWPWVDPKKDIETAIMAIRARLRSPQQVAAELGVDIEDVLDQITDFNDMLQAKGLTMDLSNQGGAPNGGEPEED